MSPKNENCSKVNLYEFISSVEHKRRYAEKCW